MKEPTKTQWYYRKLHGGNIANKCKLIVQEAFTDERIKKHGSVKYYDDVFNEGDRLRISLDTYAYNMNVAFNESEVLTIHLNNLVRFVPNTIWLRRVCELYKPLKAAKDALKEREAKQERKEQLAKWGFLK